MEVSCYRGGSEGRWAGVRQGDVMVVALIGVLMEQGECGTRWWWWWLQGGESGAGDHGELMMEGDGSGRRVVGAATGRCGLKTRKTGALAEVKVRVGERMVMVTVLQEGPLGVEGRDGKAVWQCLQGYWQLACG